MRRIRSSFTTRIFPRMTKAYYNIRRNTIYRVFSTLKGTRNMEYDIVVDEWEDTEVVIPW